MVRNRLPIIVLGLMTWVLVSTVVNPLDFRSFYAAGETLRTHPAALYSLNAQMAAQRAVGATVFLPWAHLAAEALFFVPLSLLTWRHAFYVWTAFSIALLLLAGASLGEELGSLRPIDRLGLAAVVFVPAMIGLLIGQDHGLMLLLWVLAWRKWREGDEFASGVFIGIGLIRYQFAIPFLFCLIALRKWKAIKGAGLSGSLLVLVSYFLAGPNMIPSYLHLLRILVASDPAAATRMPTIRGLATLVFPAHAEIAAGIGIAALLVWALTVIRRLDHAEAFGFAMIVSLLADYHAFFQESILLAIPAALLLRRCSLFFEVLLWSVVSLNLIGAFTFKGPALICPVLLAWAWWAVQSRSRPAAEAGTSKRPEASLDSSQLIAADKQ